MTEQRHLRTAPCAAVVLAGCLAGCGGGNTSTTAKPPAPTPTSGMRAIAGNAGWRQDRQPVEALNVYPSGFDFYNGDVGKQVNPATIARC